jgi:hypothetical protein
VAALDAAVASLGLEARDAGSTNRNEQGDIIYNQCFYLSLARAYMAPDNDDGADPPRELVQACSSRTKPLHAPKLTSACY